VKRAAASLAVVALAACAGGAPSEPRAPAPSAPARSAPRDARAIASAEPEPPPAPSPCHSDDDCRYDPVHDRCGNDPRFNPQPPVVDQGVICYCEDREKLCAKLRVWPVPCEGDASCAVDLAPRPHPVASSPAHPHEHGKPCRDYVFSTTCERTNICTLHRHACK
jgi:hypothetical protein